MTENIEIVGCNSLVEHGPATDMAYLSSLDSADASMVIDHLEQLAASRGYSKVFARVPADELSRFVTARYYVEAVIPDLLPSGNSLYFMAKYLSEERKTERQPQLLGHILALAVAQQRAASVPLPADTTFRVAREGDVAEMADIFAESFLSKKLNPGAIRAAMDANFVFYGLWRGGILVALCSAEVDLQATFAELGNLNILPEFRGQGLTLPLLQQVEANLLGLGIKLITATVHACSFANLNLARSGYCFGGTLTNNVIVAGHMQSVNVWHKSLPDDPAYAWHSMFAGCKGANEGNGRRSSRKNNKAPN